MSRRVVFPRLLPTHLLVKHSSASGVQRVPLPVGVGVGSGRGGGYQADGRRRRRLGGIPGHEVGRDGREQVAELLILAPHLGWMSCGIRVDTEGKKGTQGGGRRAYTAAAAAAAAAVASAASASSAAAAAAAAARVCGVWSWPGAGDLLLVLLLSLNHTVIRRDDHVEDFLS